MADKLHIPSPGGSEDHFEINLAMLVMGIGCIFAAYAFTHAPDPAIAKKEEAIPHTSDPVVKQLLDERSLVAAFETMSDGDLKKREWSDADRLAVYRFGPQNAAEVLCAADRSKIESGTQKGELRLELEKSLDRRTEFAPWACLVRLHFEDKIGDAAIKKEVASFVDDIRAFEGNHRITISVVDRYRKTRERPNSDAFYRWLRRCALNDDYEPHVSCRKLLSQLSPAHGLDMIEMLDRHMREKSEPADYPIFIRTLGLIARNGQPFSWNIKETKELPDYNADLKIAAVLTLCRFIQGDETSFLASGQLARTASVSLRANDKNTVVRWFITCNILFGGDEEAETISPFLATKVDDDQPHRFDLEFLRELEICKLKENYPNWYCASEAFVDRSKSVNEALAEEFVKTSYVEFIDEVNAELDREEQKAKETKKKPKVAPKEKAPKEKAPKEKAP